MTEPWARANWGAVLYKGAALDLHPTAARILAALLDRREMTYAALAEFLTPRAGASSRAIRVHICAIRKQLPAGYHIESEWGWGYRITGGPATERPRYGQTSLQGILS